MRKYIMQKYIWLFLLIALNLNGLEFNKTGNSISLSGDFHLKEIIKNQEFSKILIENCKTNFINDAFNLPIYTELIALPNSGNYKLINSEYDYEVIELETKIETLKFLQTDDWFPEEIVQIAKPVIMRGNRFVQISISPIQYNPIQNTIRILKNTDFSFEIDYSDNRNPFKKKISSLVFDKIVSQNIKGAQPSRSTAKGQYLFIAPDGYSNIISTLMRHKEKLGYSCKLETLEEIGHDAIDIKNYLQYAYDNWEFPPEYVVLVGDVNGSIQIPSFYVEGYLHPWCVTDHTYTLLDGDDYFPDILIGRFSVQDNMELMTIVSKIINYESNPFMSIEWTNSALMVGYVDEWNGFSQRETLMEIRDKLLDFEYAKVDTFIAPYQYGQFQLQNEINSGHSLICYRGAGAANYWSAGFSGHMLTIEDIEQLANGFMLPMVHGMTCAGGDFASEQYSTCFGEKWLSAGSPSNPKGAIGFIGPSEYDTKTWFNNANALGIYQGITQEGLYKCGEMLLRGKMELYNNYPNNHGWGGSEDSDQFYFYVYNLLGDPGLSVWTDIPKNITMNFESTIPSSANFLQIEIAEYDNFTIALTNADSLISTATTDENGIAYLPISLSAGSYEITASKYGYIPNTQNLDVAGDGALQLSSISLNSPLITSSENTLNFSLTNIGSSDMEEITISIVCNNEQINFPSPIINVEEITVGNSYDDEFEIDITDYWQDLTPVDFFLSISTIQGDFDFLFQSEIYSPNLLVSEVTIDNNENCLLQNEICDIEIELANIGHFTSGNIDAELICTNEKADILQASATYLDIQISGSNSANFQLLPGNVMSGEVATFQMQISSLDSLLQKIDFSIPIGIVDSTSVTFCEAGYYAIESNDVGNFIAPQYDWIEIDPDFGGDGNLVTPQHSTIDGYIRTIDLPFQFNYFGQFYHKISICSEGYLAFGETENIFHRNRNIPSGIGVPAMVAPFWDNLENGKIFTKYEDDKLIIEWSDWVNVYDPSATETFQVILFKSENNSKFGDILFQYKDIRNIDQDTYYATIGIENESQTDGLLLSFHNINVPTFHRIASETAILFTSTEESTISFLTANPTSLEFTVNPDSIFSTEITISNDLGYETIDYTLEITHFSRNSNTGGRDISNDMIYCMTDTYIPIEPMDMLFYLVHDSPDGEAVNGVTIDFPEGFYVNSATDINELSYNGETGNGAEISWGYSGSSISPISAVSLVVNVTISENLISPVELNWQIQGDGSGAAPHYSEGSLTITPTQDIYFWIRYPNGGETVLPGIVDSLVWDCYGITENVKISLSHDDGENWQELVVSAPNNGNYLYTVPGPLSDECKFKVSSIDSLYYDVSDSLFSIDGLKITYPNSQSILLYSLLDTIRWNDIGGLERVDIEISTDNKWTWSSLADNIENTGYYEFSVPGSPSTNCYLKISSLDGSIQSFSEKFQIIDSDVLWISTDVTSGSLQNGASETITLNFTSVQLPAGTYDAYINIRTNLGQVMSVPVRMEVISDIPPLDDIKLYQNYPNPFYPMTAGRSIGTSIKFELLQESDVSLKIYNLKGQHIKTIANEYRSAGEHTEIWNGRDRNDHKVRSGIYFYQLTTNKKVKTQKMIILR